MNNTENLSVNVNGMVLGVDVLSRVKDILEFKTTSELKKKMFEILSALAGSDLKVENDEVILLNFFHNLFDTFEKQQEKQVFVFKSQD